MKSTAAVHAELNASDEEELIVRTQHGDTETHRLMGEAPKSPGILPPPSYPTLPPPHPLTTDNPTV